MSVPVSAVPPMTALLTQPWREEPLPGVVGVWSEAGSGTGWFPVSGVGAGWEDAGASLDGVGEGVGVVVVGDGAGALWGDGTGAGDGVGVGDGGWLAGAGAGAGVGVLVGVGVGVGVAAGETFGAADGAWAMHEVAKRAKSKKSLNPEKPMVTCLRFAEIWGKNVGEGWELSKMRMEVTNNESPSLNRRECDGFIYKKKLGGRWKWRRLRREGGTCVVLMYSSFYQ